MGVDLSLCRAVRSLQSMIGSDFDVPALNLICRFYETMTNSLAELPQMCQRTAELEV
jgi:hypothetical protein